MNAQHWSTQNRELPLAHQNGTADVSDGDERDARRVLDGKYKTAHGPISMVAECVRAESEKKNYDALT